MSPSELSNSRRWDLWTWLVAVVGSGSGGCIQECCWYISRNIDRRIGMAISEASMIASILILPVVLTIIAQRRPLARGPFPLVVFLLYSGLKHGFTVPYVVVGIG